MARSVNYCRAAIFPQLGVKRKWPAHRESDATDPHRSSTETGRSVGRDPRSRSGAHLTTGATAGGGTQAFGFDNVSISASPGA